MKKSLLILWIGIAAINARGQTTLTLTPTKDAAIGYHDGANTAGNNYGNAVQAAGYCIPSAMEPSPGVNMNRALFDFNFACVPPGSTILSAKLNLYATGPIGSLQGHTGNNVSYLERIIQNWGEYTVSWNNQPATTSQNHITLPQSTSATQDYLNINVLPLVQDILNHPSTSFGFKLRLMNEVVTNALIFYSKDNGDSTKVPTLIITYIRTEVGEAKQINDDVFMNTFPNPANGELTILFNNQPAPEGNLSIETVDGRIIRTCSLENRTTVDISELPAGIYLAVISTTSGTRTSRKFIIAR